MRSGKTSVMLMVIALFILICVANAQAVDRQFGLGGVLGEPIGVSMKYMFTHEHALAWAVGFTPVYVHLMATIDYLYHFEDLLKTSDVVMIRPYVGGGLAGWFYNEHTVNSRGVKDNYLSLSIALRATGGFSFYFPKPQVEAFAEFSPGFSVVPNVDIEFFGVIGCRYFF